MATFQPFYSTLEALRAGDRAWFWLSLDAPTGAPPLLMTTMSKDPAMASLREMIGEIHLESGSQVTMGIATLTPEGQLQLGGPGLSQSLLLRLAGWATDNVKAQPSLARLKDLVMLNIEDDVVTGRFGSISAWSQLPELPARGTLAETVHRLKKLPAGTDAWFWLSDKGPDDEPFFALGNTKKDAQGSTFAESVSALRRQSSGGGFEATGIARCNDQGTFTLITDAELTPIAEVLEQLAFEYPELAHLGRARLVQMGDSQLVDVLILPRERDGGGDDGSDADLSAQSEALEGLSTGGVLWFWFTDADEYGEPVLVLTGDRDGLKALAREAGGEGRTLRGQVELSGKGWLHFQARNPYPGFIAALAGWVSQHHARWPALERLRGARLTCTDERGNIVARDRDDDAWASALD